MEKTLEMMEAVLPLTKESNKSRSFGSLAKGFCGSSTHVQPQEKTIAALNLHETAISKPTNQPVWKWLETDTQSFDEPLFIDSIPRESPPPSSNDVRETDSRKSEVDATVALRPPRLKNETAMPTVNEVERICEPE